MSFTTREFAARRYPRWLWPAVGVAVLVVAAALIVAFTAGGGGGDEPGALPPPATPTTQPYPTGTASTSRPAAPNPATTGTRPPSDPQYATAAPAGVTFQVVHGMQLPFSPVDGPLRVQGPVAAGYSHTPQGAALAAAQLSLRLVFAPGYAQVVEEQTAFSPELRSKFLAARGSHPQSSDRELAAAIARSVAFKVDAYSPSQATILIAGPNVNGAPGTYGVGDYKVVWSDGDWKYADNSKSTATTVNNLAGYTPW